MIALVSSIVLMWMCDECRHNYDTVTEQPLTDHIEVGTPICERCDKEMTLMDEAEIQE